MGVVKGLGGWGLFGYGGYGLRRYIWGCRRRFYIRIGVCGFRVG